MVRRREADMKRILVGTLVGFFAYVLLLVNIGSAVAADAGTRGMAHAAMVADMVEPEPEPEPEPGEALPPCETEDSDNCVWWSQDRGNGEGDSFYVIDGEVTYL